MNYSEVLEYLFHQFPQYQKIGGAAYKPGLQNISLLCEHLGNPQNNLKIIHVAGTNGKGSTCNLLASILQESGYQVGLFTSPHLIDYRERIRVNGQLIPEEYVVDFVVEHKGFFSELQASFFEWTTVLAFQYFKDVEVDFVVLETGLGGRLDATNIVNPILTVITNISIDHTQYLGDTLAKIAAEKGGIIKKRIPCVLSLGNTSETKKVIEDICQSNEAPLYIPDSLSDKKSGLQGAYQKLNIATVLELVQQLRKLEGPISDQAVEEGLKNVIKNTGFRGRWEKLQETPRVIADIGHNYEGVKELVAQLGKEKYGHLRIVWGMVADKEVEKIVGILPKEGQYYISQPDIPRALDKEVLAAAFKTKHTFTVFDDMTEAFDQAVSDSSADDLIFVGGSNFVVAEIISKYFK